MDTGPTEVTQLYGTVNVLKKHRSCTDQLDKMSEGCSWCRSCRDDNYVGGNLEFASSCGSGSGQNGTTSGSNSTSGTNNSGGNYIASTRRVQVRAKVLYGSGKAIAGLQAREKAAKH
ncbi:hypothetical protein PV327_001959 [Microctonus hyperodae]|uniref:Uncharacterized protein n=1 Tax=Microctonus hyperodae TaxID=165561 RepID=A0AA39KNK6_MICHY|nr:hypothetical protein PV327_001959 [Microctonus hyperodae]